jgi:hypothetical protein
MGELREREMGGERVRMELDGEERRRGRRREKRRERKVVQEGRKMGTQQMALAPKSVFPLNFRPFFFPKPSASFVR